MEVTFEREPGGTRLLLSEEVAAEEYSCRLLERNPGRHLLRLSRRQTEDGTLYAYEIPGGNSLAGMFRVRAITFPEIRKVMLGISQALEEAEASLLPPEHLLLEPELIFCLPDLDHMGFCCHPGVKNDFFEQMRKLLRYFLQKMDHRDGPGTESLYRLFAISEQEFFRFEDLMAEIGKGGAPEEQELFRGQEQESREAVRQVSAGELPQPAEAERESLLLPLLLLAGGILAGGAGIWLRSRNDGWDWRLFLLPCCLLACSLAMLLRRLADRLKRSREEGGRAHPKKKEKRRKRPQIQESPATEFLEETSLLGADASFALGYPQLIPLEKGAGEAALMRRFPFVIGKLKGETDLLLDIPSVSRTHARIEKKDGQLSIMDCRSTNGTWVNGVRLEPEAFYPLSPGDEIRFADVRYRLE